MGLLSIPATSSNLVLSNMTIPSGCVNYLLIAYQELASSGQTHEDFLVRQIIIQSVERYRKYLTEQDYNTTITSGVAIQKNHGQFVANIMAEEKAMIDNL